MHCCFLTAPEIVKNRKKKACQTPTSRRAVHLYIYMCQLVHSASVYGTNILFRQISNPIRRVSAGHLSCLNDGVTMVSVSHVLSVINVSLYPEPQ